ncbi:MAG: hypothetical protein GXP19_10245 [Gammaproteobacteria bacterium]|nr:hypothetical protein [Gammaproteobacteria bacterium]
MANESESGAAPKGELATQSETSNNKTQSKQEKKAENKARDKEKRVTASGKSSSAPWIASVAILFAIGAGGSSYWVWLKSNERLASLDTSFDNALTQIKQQTDDKLQQAANDRNILQSTLQNKLTEALSVNASQQKRLMEEVQHLSDSTTAISSRIGAESTTWIIAEAEYLLTLANHRIILDKDVDTAIAALTAADQRLKKVGDPGLLDVRRKISEEIIALRSVEVPDIAGMAFELAALASTAEQLPLIVKQRQLQHENTFSSTEEATGQVAGVSGIMNAVWKDIKSLIVIRKNDKPIDVLLAPDQRHFLFQNLILKIETGRLALLRSEPSNLNASLDVAQQWLQAYFDKDTAAYANFMSTLDRIRSSKLTPVFPDITKSIEVLRKYEADKANKNTGLTSQIKPTKKKEIVKITSPQITSPQKQMPPQTELNELETEVKQLELEQTELKQTELKEAEIKQPETKRATAESIELTTESATESVTAGPSSDASEQVSETTVEANKESTP